MVEDARKIATQNLNNDTSSLVNKYPLTCSHEEKYVTSNLGNRITKTLVDVRMSEHYSSQNCFAFFVKSGGKNFAVCTLWLIHKAHMSSKKE